MLWSSAPTSVVGFQAGLGALLNRWVTYSFSLGPRPHRLKLESTYCFYSACRAMKQRFWVPKPLDSERERESHVQAFHTVSHCEDHYIVGTYMLLPCSTYAHAMISFHRSRPVSRCGVNRVSCTEYCHPCWRPLLLRAFRRCYDLLRERYGAFVVSEVLDMKFMYGLV